MPCRTSTSARAGADEVEVEDPAAPFTDCGSARRWDILGDVPWAPFVGLCLIASGCIAALCPRLVLVRMLMSTFPDGDHAMACFVLDATAVKHKSRPACDSRRGPLSLRGISFVGTKVATLEHVIVSPIVGVLRYPYPRAYVEIAECLEVTLLESLCRNSYLLPPLTPWGGSAPQSRGATRNLPAAKA